jgi:hypothetical protein
VRRDWRPWWSLAGGRFAGLLIGLFIGVFIGLFVWLLVGLFIGSPWLVLDSCTMATSLAAGYFHRRGSVIGACAEGVKGAGGQAELFALKQPA